jgi:hypothetical protein
MLFLNRIEDKKESCTAGPCVYMGRWRPVVRFQVSSWSGRLGLVLGSPLAFIFSGRLLFLLPPSLCCRSYPALERKLEKFGRSKQRPTRLRLNLGANV